MDAETDEPELPDPESLELDPPELELPDEDEPELYELPELELPDDDGPGLEPDPELPELPDPLPLSEGMSAIVSPLPLPSVVVLLPIPSPVLSFAGILDKSVNIGLSLLVIPYAATAAAIHKTIIIEIIKFALSKVFPPIKLIKL